MKHKAHVSQYKKDELTRIKSLLLKYKIIAVADMTSMPSVQLQRLRSSLKGSVLITMSKGRIIKIALEDLKDKVKNIQELESYVRGMPALLLTNE
ncbi:MAG TPA: 50S ribosomal protein L10, partial [Nanoarchaeota archaeon]|nr:50S ribosomal protein L10 [Nanoarchaeota archaeon]